MPELPEVENYRQVAQKALKKTIDSTEILRPKVLGAYPFKKLQSLLKANTITGATRHGKHLFLSLKKGGWLALHFGLSGSLRYLRSLKKAKGGIFFIHFKDKTELVYSSLFGKITLVKDPSRYVQKQKLGPDALKISWPEFRTIALSKNTDIKTLLMDQHNLAGVGNMYSDEALFRAGVHPATSIKKLGQVRLKKVYDQLHAVLKEMAEIRSKGEWVFPQGYLSPHREEDRRCPRDKGKLQTILRGGRKCYFCPRCQPLKNKGMA